MPTRRNAEAGRLEAWIVENSTVVALAIFAVAFVIRLYYANASYINPDEALHFDTARPATWVEAFKSSLRITHPPLFILVLHGFMVFGRSELILRLPSLLGWNCSTLVHIRMATTLLWRYSRTGGTDFHGSVSGGYLSRD